MTQPGDENQRWFDALTGRTGDAEATPDAREGEALRKVIVAEDQRKGAGHDREGNLDALMGRLEQEGLLEPQPKRIPGRRWYLMAASVAAVVLVVPIVLKIATESPQAPPIEIPRGAIEPVEIKIDDPESASTVLAQTLRDLGADVERYEYEGRWIVDARLQPTTSLDAVGKALREYGVTVPPDRRLLLAFVAK